jgi:Papain family cysteine protease
MVKRKRKLNANPDVPDFRDYIYEPALIQLQETITPPEGLKILDQYSEGACTGFSLAACINQLYRISNHDIQVSARMLYEMAKRSDEWPGEDYDGSSLRGAIRGWKNMGVCQESEWEYRTSEPGDLTVKRAKDARNHTIGAYYRLKPEVTHFHAALNEVGVIAVSANVHKGWNNPHDGIIEYHDKNDGGHAFAIVGYNDSGFWIQNSWGNSWGRNGLALWSYEDWNKNILDAWVFRLALPTPQIFGMRPGVTEKTSDAGKTKKPTIDRSRIAGHFVHIDDGRYKESGRYWSTANDVEETARLVASSNSYKHLLIYAHGGLNSPEDSANRIAAMKDVFKANRIYPFHIMYDTGVMEELKDLIWRKDLQAEERVGGFTDWTDRFLEGLLRRPGTLLWDEMKRDANDAFMSNGAGTDAINRFLNHFKKSGKNIKIHIAGHSTGAIVLAHMLNIMKRKNVTFSSCSLLAPACSVELYKSNYLPVLQNKHSAKITDMAIYNLKDKLELDDNVAAAYRKSLLYLVSNAFERVNEKPILGMEKFKHDIVYSGKKPTMIYSNGISGSTRSTSHGGFDNDRYTMNHILRRVLKDNPARPFTEDDLSF